MSKIYHSTLHVRGYELDSFGHVNHAIYVSYLEHARWEMLLEEQITLEKFMEWKRWPVIASIELHYLKPTFLNDKLDVSTRTATRSHELHLRTNHPAQGHPRGQSAGTRGRGERKRQTLEIAARDHETLERPGRGRRNLRNPRRFINWETVKGPKAITAVILGTAGGAGLTPIAPGTMGTLVGMPIAYFTANWAWEPRVAVWLFILALGTWAAKVFDETMGSSDNQCIVIDEVLGLGITAWTSGTDPKSLFACFVFFRFFDILKPPPVRQMDRWSKIKASNKADPAARWWGGFGVMADDVLAGFQALAVILVLQYFKVL